MQPKTTLPKSILPFHNYAPSQLEFAPPQPVDALPQSVSAQPCSDTNLNEEDARRRLKNWRAENAKDRKYKQIWGVAQNFISKEEIYKSTLCSYEIIYL